jgi:hypothetical protein
MPACSARQWRDHTRASPNACGERIASAASARHRSPDQFGPTVANFRREHLRRRGVSQQSAAKPWEEIVNGLIYLIGLIVVILFILSFFGLR